jgi:uncharacterized DUF497 family protein
MEFEWDETQSETCFQERGFDFAYAAQAFFDPNRLIRADQRHGYGEDRFQLTARIDSRIFVVVYTPRANATRIISARKANTREVTHYENDTNED